MINFILQYPLFYRLYQKTVRKNNHEYDLFKFIFSELSKDKKLKMLDLCSGDSFVLKYVGEYLDEYVGIDNNEKYLKKLKGDWPKFKFINADINELNNLEIIKNFYPDIIFMNGAIHHLNDNVMSKINLFISKYEKSKFLSVDPIKFENGIINKLMINLDRGKYIRTLEEYKNVMKGINHFVIDDFYKMSFQNIFHNRNFDLNKLYYEWKNSLKN
tara:strand:- start:924 stop:1568 length:645 start_codon:yes stop_codon:yes gene_type:complete